MAQVEYYGEKWGDEEDEIDKAYIENGKIFLPHSCDEWTIGGIDQAEELIADLKELIKKLKELK